MIRSETIAAVATGEGGAISVIRVSGADAVAICDRIFKPVSGGSLSSRKGFSLVYGIVSDGERVIDDVMVSLFRAPRSYTGEDTVEISCHASPYIKGEIIRLLCLHGAVSAQPGEFTLRAFLNGKLDLSQAEAVADIIASENREAHSVAVRQIRSGYSECFRELREKLVELVSLLELELDFSEEEVEFADRDRLAATLSSIKERILSLKDSFSLGNVLKNGVPTVIAGAPNVGKSTLLNALVREERAMVSDIAGTTRDTIEESVIISGIRFRFIDTAGIRATNDPLESMGIERTFSRIRDASVVILVTEASASFTDILCEVKNLETTGDQRVIVMLNKADKLNDDAKDNLERTMSELKSTDCIDEVIPVSAKYGYGMDKVCDVLYGFFSFGGISGDTLVSNSRHHESLVLGYESLCRAEESLSGGASSELISGDLREVIRHLSIITGDISTDDILSSIFSKFCIGK